MSNNILIVIDMQNDFINGSLGTKEAESIVPNVVNKIKNHNGPVFYTMDTHSEGYLDTPEGQKLPVKHCIKGTDGWKLNPEVEIALKDKGAVEFVKPTFGSLELMENIQHCSCDSIEVIGLCTDICVISNVLLLKTANYNTPITVDAACCAGVTPEKHKSALDVMESCHIDIENRGEEPWKSIV